MKNITLALDEESLAAGRARAERHHTTFSALVRDLLARTVHVDRTAGRVVRPLVSSHSAGWRVPIGASSSCRRP